jgi:voltage-gated potassium channel
LNIFKKLKRVIEETDTISGRIFDLSIQLLVIISIVSFSIETLPNLSTTVQNYLRLAETVVVIIFTLEYLLRFIVTNKKMKFIFSFSSTVDLLAILPFYLSTGIDLRSLRIFRLFRIARVLKLVRFTNAIEHFAVAFREIKDELKVFFITMLFVLYLSAVGIYYFENPVQPEIFSSIFHSLWWGVTTLTTVGYGDMYPITVGGRIFTFFILLIGLGIVAVPTGLISTALSSTANRYKKE